MSSHTRTKSSRKKLAGAGGSGGVLKALVSNGKLFRLGSKEGLNSQPDDASDRDHLTKLPRNLVSLIFHKALDPVEGEREDGGRAAVRTLATLASTCKTFREILYPDKETVACDFAHLPERLRKDHHCHLNSDYPHSWYFDVAGYVCTDDMHALTTGGSLWNKACVQMLGGGICDLHTVCGAYADGLCRENAIFWRNLCRDAAALRVMHWSKGAHLVLKHNKKVADDAMARRTIQLDPEVLRAQEILNTGHQSRCNIPGPWKPCLRSSAVPPFERGALPEEPGAAPSTSRGGRTITDQERAEAERVLSSKWKELASTFLLDKRIPRSGHRASQMGDFIIIVGGSCPANLPIVDVLLIHIPTLTIRCPKVHGEPPAKRFRQSLTPIFPSHSSPLASDKGDHVLLMYGGWDGIRGEEYGGKEVSILTVAANGDAVTWRHLSTTGQIPSPRFNHCAEIVNANKTFFVYGGEGEQVEAKDTCCYLLDLKTLVWRRVPTFGSFKSRGQNHPMARCLATSLVRRAQGSGSEEIVLFGGFSTGQDRVAFDMCPYCLDLDTMIWTHTKTVTSEVGRMPRRRFRSSVVRLKHDRVLLVGGVSEAGVFLDEIEQLNVSDLKWEDPPLVLGQPSGQAVFGGTAAGLVVFGGGKMDVLQIGPPPKDLADLVAGSGAAESVVGRISKLLGRGKNKDDRQSQKFNMSQVIARHRASLQQ